MPAAVTDVNLKTLASVKAPSCPNCGGPYIKRVRRATTYERLISLLYIYPFRCQLCGHGFTLFQPRVRYVRVDEDQREYQRIPVNLPVTLVQDDMDSNGSAIDISMRGCTVKTGEPLAMASIVKLGLKIPNEKAPLTVDAAVICNRSADRIGIEFLRFQADERQRLRNFVHSLLASPYLNEQ